MVIMIIIMDQPKQQTQIKKQKQKTRSERKSQYFRVTQL